MHSLLLSIALLTSSQSSPAERVATVHTIEFHSSFWMNLHHTLYAAAWATRPEAGTLRALAGALPSRLAAPLSDDERTAWTEAVDFYNREVAARDLLLGKGMWQIKVALAAGDLASKDISDAHRAVLDRAAPIYRRHYWPAHDRANRAWIEATVGRLETIGAAVIKDIERLYGTSWFKSPARADVVWVGNRQGAYTTNEPPHAVISSGDPQHVEWTSVEIVFHELTHPHILGIQRELNKALGDAAKRHGVAWHPIQFHLTGAAVQRALAGRKIDYTPYLYATGLLDRAWAQYRRILEEYWQPFVEGKMTREEAINRTAAVLQSR